MDPAPGRAWGSARPGAAPEGNVNEDEIIATYRPVVEAAARRWAHRSKGWHDVEDLAQSAYLAIVRAARSHRPELGSLAGRILGIIDFAMVDHMRAVDGTNRRGWPEQRPERVGMDLWRIEEPAEEPGFDRVEDRLVLEDFLRWMHLSARNDRIVRVALTCDTQRDAARAAGVAESEVSRAMSKARAQAPRYAAICFQ